MWASPGVWAGEEVVEAEFAVCIEEFDAQPLRRQRANARMECFMGESCSSGRELDDRLSGAYHKHYLAGPNPSRNERQRGLDL
jgi:hypothetical protein